MSGPGYSHDGLHIILWERRTGAGTTRIQQAKFSDELRITRYTLNRIMRAGEIAGRWRSLTKSRGSTVKTYVVTDPAVWFAEHADDETNDDNEDGDTDE